jgi:hypothetical protein
MRRSSARNSTRSYSASCVSDASRASCARPTTLAFDDIEYRGYMLQTDIVRVIELGGIHEGGEIYRFTDEEAMETAIGMFTATCTHCLRDFIKPQPAS